jgi:hypothetical protein
LSLALALLLGSTAAHSLFTQSESVGSHSRSQTEAKELARSASTPEDHLRLAAYLRDQAQQEEAASRFNQQLASASRDSPLAYQGHMYSVREEKENFGYLAKKTSKAAAKLNKMAAQEEVSRRGCASILCDGAVFTDNRFALGRA